MAGPMTREDVIAFRGRWAAVNAAEEEETRRTPISVKLHQLSALMASAGSFGWVEVPEEEQVRERWLRLRLLSGV
jgi:hypothetical protein